MSEAPVLTKKQQKQSLSAKKTKTRETIKNCLISPYKKYRPLISNEHHELLQSILEQCLPNLKLNKIVPWKELRKIPKVDRKKFKQEYINKQQQSLENCPPPVVDRNGIILGINDVTKAIENSVAKCVLTTEDVEPKFMTQHVIDQSVLMKIPILVVPNLRDFLKETCGIPSVALAFADCQKYSQVQNVVEDIFRNYPVPVNYINYHRIDKEAESESKLLCNVDIRENPSKKVSEDNQEGNNHLKKIYSNIYLTRTTKDKRVFIPKKSSDKLKNDVNMTVDSTGFLPFSTKPPSEPKNNSNMIVDSTGFLSFSTKTTSELKNNSNIIIDLTSYSPVSTKTTSNYESLKVKRIKGDVNRNKRKNESMKKKKAKKSKKN